MLTKSELESLEMDLAGIRRHGSVAAYLESRGESPYDAILIDRLEKLIGELKGEN